MSSQFCYLSGLEHLLQPLPDQQADSCRLVTMLWCYLDDSGTNRESPAVTMAGYVAPSDEWRHFEIGSRKLFKRENVSFFHAKEFHDRKDDFQGWPLARQLRFIQEWFDLAGHHVLAGISLNMPREKFDIAKKHSKTSANRSAYGNCFNSIIDFLLSDAEVGAEIIDKGISFLIEAGASGNAGVLDIFNKRREHDGDSYLQQLSFIDKKSCYAIQLADFIAFYTRRHASEYVAKGEGNLSPFANIAKEKVRTIAQLAKEFSPVSSSRPRQKSS